MANTYHISGGGDALRTFLASASNYTVNSLVYVAPGIYNCPTGTGRLAQRDNLSVVGEGLTRDEVIIKGAYCDSLSSEVGNSWFNIKYTNSSSGLLSNVTLSGMTKSNLNGNTLKTITIANSIVDCNIYDCSCVLSSAVRSELMLYVNNGVRNCHISGIHGFNQLIRTSNGLYYCLVEDFSCPLYTDVANNAFIQNSARGCIFRRIFSPLVFIQGNGAGLFGCILDEISGTGTSFRYDYNYENTINCLFIGCKGFRSYMASLGIAKNNIFCGCQDTNSTYPNLYRCPATTGTSALNLVAMNNIFDVPISQCRDFQTAINNNGVAGKYAYTSGNQFNVPISAMGFVDVENGNYYLKNDSPLISAGTNFTDFVHSYKSTFPNNQLDMNGVRFKKENPSVGPYQSTAPFKPGNIPIDQYPLG